MRLEGTVANFDHQGACSKLPIGSHRQRCADVRQIARRDDDADRRVFGKIDERAFGEHGNIGGPQQQLARKNVASERLKQPGHAAFERFDCG